MTLLNFHVQQTWIHVRFQLNFLTFLLQKRLKILTKGNNKPHFCHNCFTIDNPFTYVDTTIGNNFSRKVDKSSVPIDRDGRKKVWVFEMSNVCLIRPIDLYALQSCEKWNSTAVLTHTRPNGVNQKNVKRLPPTHCQIIIELEPLKLSTG